MIIDSLENSSLYNSVKKRFAAAFEHIMKLDFDSVEPGRYEIDGEDIFFMINDSDLKTPENAALEVHDKYIDIQIPLSKAESFGWSDRKTCMSPRGEMNTEKDILFFDDKPSTYFTLQPREFCIFLPGDAHAPLVGDGKSKIRKCIIKVKA